MSIEIKSLGHHFGNQTVFQDFNLSLRSGRLTALLGPSGCGKSTLLRLIAGLLPVQAGTIEVPLELSKDRAMVFQDASLLPWRTTQENTLLPLELKGKLDSAAKQRCIEIFQYLGLLGSEKKFPFELSGGMKMRASLARALISRPRLILLDEPFSALDEETREQLQILTRNLIVKTPASRQRTGVFVTHSINEALFVADDIFVLSGQGKIALRVELPREKDQDLSADFLISEAFLRLKQHWTPKIREVLK